MGPRDIQSSPAFWGTFLKQRADGGKFEDILGSQRGTGAGTFIQLLGRELHFRAQSHRARRGVEPHSQLWEGVMHETFFQPQGLLLCRLPDDVPRQVGVLDLYGVHNPRAECLYLFQDVEPIQHDHTRYLLLVGRAASL